MIAVCPVREGRAVDDVQDDFVVGFNVKGAAARCQKLDASSNAPWAATLTEWTAIILLGGLDATLRQGFCSGSPFD